MAKAFENNEYIFVPDHIRNMVLPGLTMGLMMGHALRAKIVFSTLPNLTYNLQDESLDKKIRKELAKYIWASSCFIPFFDNIIDRIEITKEVVKAFPEVIPAPSMPSSEYFMETWDSIKVRLPDSIWESYELLEAKLKESCTGLK